MRKLSILFTVLLLIQTIFPNPLISALGNEGMENFNGNNVLEEDVNNSSDNDLEESNSSNSDLEEDDHNSNNLVEEDDTFSNNNLLEDEEKDSVETEDHEENVEVENDENNGASGEETDVTKDGKLEEEDESKEDKQRPNNSLLLVDSIEEGFNLTKSEITDLSGVEFDSNNPFDPNGEFKLTVEWTLDDNHGFQEGSKVRIELPKQINYSATEQIELRDGENNLVAIVTFENSDKPYEATITFTDYVEQSSEVKGKFQIIAELDKNKAEENKGNVEIDRIGEEGKHQLPINLEERKKDIQKKGEPDRRYEAEFIDWEIIVNTERTHLKNPRIEDIYPEGLELDRESLRVYKDTTSVNGTVLESEDVTEEFETSFEFDNESRKFSIELNEEIFEQYRITYRTQVVDTDMKEFTNNVNFITKDDPDKHAKATVQIVRGDPLTKQSTAKGFDPVTGIIEWEIEFNYNQKALEDVTLTDYWTIDSDHAVSLVDGEVIFTEVEIDEEGKAHETNRVGLPEGAKLVETENGFEVQGITTDKAYKITYKTKIDGRVIDEVNLSNTAAFGPHEVEGKGPGKIGRYYGSKTAGKINYVNKTVEWTIQLNQDKYPMGNIVIEDTLGKGLTLIEESVEVNGANAPLPKIEVDGQQVTFIFPEDYVAKDTFEITYQTTFDPNETENNEAINTATIYWTPGEEGEKQKGNVTAKTHFNDETKNMNWKNAYYDQKTKKINGEIIVKYR